MGAAEKLAAELDDLMGENDEHLGIQQWLDTGLPELNHVLSGSYTKGAAVGRLYEIFGGASCGKTFLSTMLMIAAQKAGGLAVFADHERSFEPELAKSLGLDMSPSKFRYLRPETFEVSVDLAVQTCEKIRKGGLISPDAPIVWVFDSVASMIPSEKMYDKNGNRRPVGDYNMRDKLALASATSQSYPALAQFADDNNMLVLLLNQIRTNPGVMYGDPETTPGGKSAEFYCSTRLSLGKKEIDNGLTGAKKEVIGFRITGKTVKNKVARPFRKAIWDVIFNKGLGVEIDRLATNLDFICRSGLLEKAGAYYIWEGKKLYQKDILKRLRADDKAHEKLMALLPDDDEELDAIIEEDDEDESVAETLDDAFEGLDA